MKYARTERERRFLLRQLPADLPASYRRISDLYLDGTRLRLRRIEDPDGRVLQRKLGQKQSDDPGGAGLCCTMTNVYLDAVEYERLRPLGGAPIVKRRYAYPRGHLRFIVDVFEQELHGLLLAEIELDTDAAASALPIPDFAAVEVTADRFFTGGALARTTAAQLARELARWGCAPIGSA